MVVKFIVPYIYLILIISSAVGGRKARSVTLSLPEVVSIL